MPKNYNCLLLLCICSGVVCGSAMPEIGVRPFGQSKALVVYVVQLTWALQHRLLHYNP